MARPVHILDATKPLSAAVCDALLAGQGGSFELARTMLLVPAGRLARAVERELLRRAKAGSVVLAAPTIVTPLMLAGRFIEPRQELLSRFGSEVSWREAIEEVERRDPELLGALGAAFGSRDGIPVRMRARVASRLARLGAEVATGLHTIASVRSAVEAATVSESGAAAGRVALDPALAAHWKAIEAVACVRAELLARAGVADRDESVAEQVRAHQGHAAPVASGVQAKGSAALRDHPSVAGRLFDRVVVLFADPEPVHRALLGVLERSGVSVEVCVHAADDIDGEGFPKPEVWAERAMAPESVSDSAIRVAESMSEAASVAVGLVRSLPAPRRSDSLAIMAPDEDTRREIERALGEAGSCSARAESRPFAATRLGTLLARLEELLGEASAASLAAFVRHPDVSSWLVRASADEADAAPSEAEQPESDHDPMPEAGEAGTGPQGAVLPDRAAADERDLGIYRANTLVESFQCGVVKARGARGFRSLQGRIATLMAHAARATQPDAPSNATSVQPLEGVAPLEQWARVLRAMVASIVGESHDSGASGSMLDPATAAARAVERTRSIELFDRGLRLFAELPKSFATPYRLHEAVALLRAQLDREEVRGDAWQDGVTVVRWLDIGVADEPHLVLAGCHDGVVPEGEVSDPLLPDALRRSLGLLSSQRRAARDAWILDGILTRAQARRNAGLPASVHFVLSRRTIEGEPLLPSRFLLRVPPAALPARIATLFPAEREVEPKPAALVRSAAFPITPPVGGSQFKRISVTAFRSYLQCPYLFQLRHDPRLALSRSNERAAELDSPAFGNLLHAATERWGRDEAARHAPTTDPDRIERDLSAHLDAHVSATFPRSCAAAVRVQVELVRRRLKRFARLQAHEAEQGWMVRFVEQAFRDENAPWILPLSAGQVSVSASASASGAVKGLRLVGRIDRIDENLATGEWRALDYKSGSDADPPTKTHLVGRPKRSGEPRAWKDLQLPLYSLLLASMPGKPGQAALGPGSLGYISLAPSDEQSSFQFLACSDDEFREAFELARRIVEEILSGNFAPVPRAPVSRLDPLAPIWGLGQRVQASLDDEPAAGSASAETAGEGGAA